MARMKQVNFDLMLEMMTELLPYVPTNPDNPETLKQLVGDMEEHPMEVFIAGLDQTTQQMGEDKSFRQGMGKGLLIGAALALASTDPEFVEFGNALRAGLLAPEKKSTKGKAVAQEALAKLKRLNQAVELIHAGKFDDARAILTELGDSIVVMKEGPDGKLMESSVQELHAQMDAAEKKLSPPVEAAPALSTEPAPQGALLN